MTTDVATGIRQRLDEKGVGWVSTFRSAGWSDDASESAE